MKLAGSVQSLGRCLCCWCGSVFCLAFLVLVRPATPAVLVLDDAPSIAASTMFSCRIRQLPDGAWATVFPYMTTSGVSYKSTTRDLRSGYFESLENWTATWVSFEVDSVTAVELEITKLHGDGRIASAVAHPSGRADALAVTAGDGKALLSLTGPQQLTVDIDGALDEHDTGWSAWRDSWPASVHTFSIFANPMLGDNERPDPTASNVRTVQPGVLPPQDFDEDILYFLPGVHNLTQAPACCTAMAASPSACPCDFTDAAAPGYVAPFLLRSNKSYYVPTDAWLDGMFANEGWGLHGVKVFGYGVLSGRLFQGRADDNHSPKGMVLRGMYDCRIEGLTLVDHPNHFLILVGHGGKPSEPNSLAFVKVLGWRANGDGLHAFKYWSHIHDVFFRTQDDSMYLGGGSTEGTLYSRITTWNDANGVPFIFSAGAGSGHNVTLQDSDVIYHRKQFPYWCGAIFDLRDAATSIHDIMIRRVHISDPFPTCPLLDLFGGLSDINFEDVSMRSHSTVEELTSFYCKKPEAEWRFDLPASFGCSMPFGIPNRLFGLAPNRQVDPDVWLADITFRNVSINGTQLSDLYTLPQYSGSIVTGGNLKGISCCQPSDSDTDTCVELAPTTPPTPAPTPPLLASSSASLSTGFGHRIAQRSKRERKASLKIE